MQKPSCTNDQPVFQTPAPVKRSRVLLIEDDADTAEAIISDLQERGYQVLSAATGPEGVSIARSTQFDAMIVDRMLPQMDGLAVIATLRSEGIRTPVLVLSALGAVDDRVMGLKAGGDDYLTKPFALVELAARTEALMRRPIETRETTLTVGPLTLDLLERTGRRETRAIELLPREFKILEYMMRRPEQVITRDMLLEDVWHYRFLPQTNLVDVHIGKLRRKVDVPGELPLIRGVRGAGFILTTSPHTPETPSANNV